MIITQESYDNLVEAVNNAQTRLADVKFLEILEQLLPVIDEMKFKIDAIENFLSSDETVENQETVENEKKEEVVESPSKSKAKTKSVEDKNNVSVE